MSVHTIYDCAGYRIYRPYDGRRFKHGDVIALPYDSRSHGQLWRFYTLGTVEGYAIANGECPHEALKRHEEHGHDRRYWANQNATVLHNGPAVQEQVPGFEPGQSIILQGKAFTIGQPDCYGNIELQQA